MEIRHPNTSSETQRLYALFERYPAVVTDSRRACGGTLFFALKGERFDGNRFARAALEAGAACAVVDDPQIAAEADSGRIVIVDDALEALQALAREHRRRLGIPLIAIAGSNGKTTTKELIGRVLAKKYEVCATQGNLNNHIGVPLTLLSMTRDTEIGVVEMGASACGEIARLCAIAEPDCGLLTNVGLAHLEGFGGAEGVRRGKGELYDYLAATGGRAFVRRDDPTLAEMAAERSRLTVEFYDSAIADGVPHALAGEFNRPNIAAAMAVGRRFGVGERSIREAVASYRPDNHRSQRMRTARRTLIVDCYNANPSSMQAALANLSDEPHAGGKAAVLGDMLELGAWSRTEHRAAIEQALAGGVDRLWLVGREFARAWHSLEKPDVRVRLFESCDAAIAACDDSAFEGMLVLVKGSHGIGLERLAERLAR